MYSLEHKKYLKDIKIRKILIIFTQFIILILFMFIWQFAADKELINTFITSSPKEIVRTIISLWRANNLWNHIWITVFETLISFILATVLGIAIATVLWWNKFIAKALDPYLTIINSLPKVALGPIIIIWAGAGMKSIIIMALLISLILTIMNVYQGFIETDFNKIKLLKSFKATKRQLYFKLILPNSFSTIVSTLKINISMSLIGVIMGEFLVSKEGIGYLIMYGSQVFNLNLVMAGIVILCIVASIMYYAILCFEKVLLRNI